MKNSFLIIGLFFLANTLIGQTSIYGKVTMEETGEELIYANIVLNKNGVFAAGGSTDFEGNYSIPLDPGTYEMTINYTGFLEQRITGIIIKAGQGTKLDIKMEEPMIMHAYFDWGYKIPLIDQEDTTTGHIKSSEQIRREPNKKIKELLLSTPGVSISNF